MQIAVTSLSYCFILQNAVVLISSTPALGARDSRYPQMELQIARGMSTPLRSWMRAPCLTPSLLNLNLSFVFIRHLHISVSFRFFHVVIVGIHDANFKSLSLTYCRHNGYQSCFAIRVPFLAFFAGFIMDVFFLFMSSLSTVSPLLPITSKSLFQLQNSHWLSIGIALRELGTLI